MPKNPKIRVRMAPSPTGGLHIGTARTAMFCYLFARSQQGQYILRIEDTDTGRSTPESEKEILEGLDWLGIQADEGILADGSERGKYGPYRQSKRTDIYTDYLAKLLESEKAYKCYCTVGELDAERARQRQAKQAPVYSGHCRHLSPEQIQAYKTAKQHYTIRFAVPDDRGKICFTDIIRGEIKTKSNLLGDFVIAKDMNTPLYNLVNVVDDHLMQISHVIRGEDHISNTPKQILIYEALGWDIPQFAHLPLLLDKDKSKLSKRSSTSEVMVNGFQSYGYLPEAMVNYISSLGWNDGTDKEIYSMQDLEQQFSLEKVGKSGSIYDYERAKWYNSQYIKNINTTELSQKIKIWAKATNTDINLENINKILALIQNKMSLLADYSEQSSFYYQSYTPTPDLLANEKMKVNKEGARVNLAELLPVLESIAEPDWTAENLKEIIIPWIKTKELKNGQVLWPLRVAITAAGQSPGAFEVAELFGKEESTKRIKATINAK